MNDMVVHFADIVKEYYDLDNILEWYSYELHTNDSNTLFNIFDTLDNVYVTNWQDLMGCAIKTLQLFTEKKAVNLNQTYYTTCIVKFIDDSLESEVIIKSDNTIIESEDEQIFFYGLSINDIIDMYLNGSSSCEDWVVKAILNIEN